jgi:hypothetical protein
MTMDGCARFKTFNEAQSALTLPSSITKTRRYGNDPR